MSNTKKEIEILIDQAKKRDQKAFKILLNTFWSDVYRFQLSKTKDEDEAEDITIKTFSKAFEKIEMFDDSYNFKTWLLSISKNLFIDHIRKQKTDIISINRKESEAYKIFDESPSAEDQLITQQNLSQLLHHLKQLKPHYQEVINLRYFREMSYKEMAETINEPLSNIKIKLLRAKKLLAEIIINTSNK